MSDASIPDSRAVAAPGSLEAVIAAQQAVIAELRSRIADLERRLGLNSGNSSKPPSSDGLKKNPSRVSSLRDRSGKKPGGQQGHPGKTLCRIETPDAAIDHFPPACAGCGAVRSFRRRRARSCGGGTGQASGRDRLSHRWQNMVAAYRLDRSADILPNLGQARQSARTGPIRNFV